MELVGNETAKSSTERRHQRPAPMKPKASKSRRRARVPLQGLVLRPLRATLTPVPLGATIQPWHWWMNSVLNMTEAERAYYHGFPVSGMKLDRVGELYEVRVARPQNNDMSGPSDGSAPRTGSAVPEHL